MEPTPDDKAAPEASKPATEQGAKTTPPFTVNPPPAQPSAPGAPSVQGRFPPKPPTVGPSIDAKAAAQARREIEDALAAAKTVLANHERNLRIAKRWAPLIRDKFVNPVTTKSFQAKGAELGLDESFRFDIAIDAPNFKVMVAVIPRADSFETVELPFCEALGYHMGSLGLSSVEELLLRLNSKPWIVAAIGLAWALFNYGILVSDIAGKIIERNAALKAEAERKAAAEAASGQLGLDLAPSIQ